METLKCSAPRGISSHDKGCPVRGYGLQITVSGISSSQIVSFAMKKRIHILYEFPLNEQYNTGLKCLNALMLNIYNTFSVEDAVTNKTTA